ncbi:MAG: T9SS type A sorting domain-containing protein [Bacteroidales bacterium]|nr:T9SS type A sorting domain-containing protein [Bacteroidales bacterium]
MQCILNTNSVIIKSILSIGICLYFFFLSTLLPAQSRWLQSYFPGQNVVAQDFSEYYDHGYLMTGKFGPNYVHYVWLLKTDINGEIFWQKTFGETVSYIGFFSMATNHSGDIFLSGSTTYYGSVDPLIMKLNACGEKEWCRIFYSPTHFDYAHSIVATEDGGCAVILRYTGTFPPNFDDRICLARFSANGDLLWKQCYNSTDPYLDSPDSRHLLETPGKGFLITAKCGYLDTAITNMYWLKHYYIKTDSLGNFEWETVVHADNNLQGGDAWTTTMDPGNNYYYSSVSHYYHQTNFSSPALIKLDLNGNVIDIYDIVSGYINGGLTYATFIDDTTLAANCVYGNTSDDYLTITVLIDTLGNILNYTDLGSSVKRKVLKLSFDNKLPIFFDVLQNNQFDVYLRKLNINLEDDTIYTQPFTYDSLCPYQIVSDTIVQDDCGLIVGIEEAGEHGGMEAWGRGGVVVYPNPVREVLSVRVLGLSEGIVYSLEIYDVFGRLAPTPALPQPGEGEIRVDVSGLVPGIYLAVVRDKKHFIGSAKFVVVR